jgi:AcrR family transcriptional regulator
MSSLASLKAQQGEETKEAILTACLNLFSKHGFVSTSIDGIARAAGITKGAVYWHFNSKEDLFMAILERIRARWQKVVLQPVSAVASPRAKLEALFDAYLEFFTQNPEICFFMQRILLEDDRLYSPRIGKILSQTAMFVAKILNQGIANGEFDEEIDPSLIAQMVVGVLAGASQQTLVNRSLTLKTYMREAKQTTLSRVLR